MKVTMEATDKIVEFGGVKTRVWRGNSDRTGAACLVFVLRIASSDPAAWAEMERELIETVPPGRDVPLSSVV